MSKYIHVLQCVTYTSNTREHLQLFSPLALSQCKDVLQTMWYPPLGWQSALGFRVTELEARQTPSNTCTDIHSGHSNRTTLINDMESLPLEVTLTRVVSLGDRYSQSYLRSLPAALPVRKRTSRLQDVNLCSQSRRRTRYKYLQEGNMLFCFP